MITLCKKGYFDVNKDGILLYLIYNEGKSIAGRIVGTLKGKISSDNGSYW